jgi:DNA uptake protein ComE-like DNA-binding protein/outer membrane murein-binding lipoprotein Lpp
MSSWREELGVFMKRAVAHLILTSLVLAGCASPSQEGQVSSGIQDSQEMQSEVKAETSQETSSQDDSDEGEPTPEDGETDVANPDETVEEEVVEPTKVSNPATTTLLMTLVGNLEVEQEVGSGYDRDLFKHWSDADGDGCNARYEVLIEESLTPVTVASGCKISGGTWVSAFDLVQTSNPSNFDVDHMVPLKEAWDSGAWAWDANTRQAYANDLDYGMSLIAVSASSNRSKSDRDPADWLPTNKDYWCEYITAWVQVKTRWSLSVDPKEKSKIEEVADDCSGEALDFAPKASTVTAAPSPTKTSTPSPSPTKTSSPSPSPTQTATSTPSPEPSPAQTASGGCGPGQVDLNTASVDELKLIKYIDEKRAPLVIELRPFTSVDQLINVKGIGPTYLQRIKDEGVACVN